jgi:hypothetical protein
MLCWLARMPLINQPRRISRVTYPETKRDGTPAAEDMCGCQRWSMVPRTARSRRVRPQLNHWLRAGTTARSVRRHRVDPVDDFRSRSPTATQSHV